MQPPDELMTQLFLPAMRQLVALRLRSQGLSQNRISTLLGVTQASISLYLSSGAKRPYDSLSTLSVSRTQADRYSAELATAVTQNAVEGVNELNRIWTAILGSGSACLAHRSLYPSLSNCDMCIREYGQGEGTKSQTISEVSQAVKMLEGSPKFVAVMPEVSVNIACAAGDAKTPADIVAVPGRVVKVKGRAKAMLPPEAGASVHMSKVLLLARSRHPELRACINLRYDAKIARVMRKAGLGIMTIGRYSYPGAEDPTVEALERKLESSPGPFDVVVDEGGSGIEPNVYLFAKGAREVAELAIKLARTYSAA
jgi:predicted fused transcriptional regulator/phosphomethylpyrimidine kinase/predicted transcriptional regulator